MVAAQSPNLQDEKAMVECLGTVGESVGEDLTVPDDPPEGEPELFVSAENACRNVAMLEAVLQAAGEDLTYDNLAAGAEALEVQVPGFAQPFVFGAGEATDGDQVAEVFERDAAAEDFVRVD